MLLSYELVLVPDTSIRSATGKSVSTSLLVSDDYGMHLNKRFGLVLPFQTIRDSFSQLDSADRISARLAALARFVAFVPDRCL
jgi:hypothetical protein